jgi:hypothetical protein
MTGAQSWLIVGGLLNLFIGVIAAFALYWTRVRDPNTPAQRYGLVTHKTTLWNGFLLLGLAVAIEHTNFTPTINTWLAATEVIATLLADGRNILSWFEGKEDEFAQSGELRRRIIGLGNLLHLVTISAILYGVGRTALGLW